MELSRISAHNSDTGSFIPAGVVVNFRGCAFTEISGREDAPKQLYHGGWTNDLRCALSFLSHYAPNAPLHGTGFSLGANILARYLGEEGEFVLAFLFVAL